MSRIKKRVALVAACCVFSLASVASAQDYDITEVSGKYVERSSAGSTYRLSDDSNVSVNLPFGFFYYGRTFNRIYIHSNGYAQLTDTTPSGSDFSNESFPPTDSRTDGILAPLWDDLDPANAGTVSVVASFTTGTAPNRKFIASWEAMERFSGAGAYWFQVQLDEGTGRITFAYKAENSPSTWTNLSYSIGIEEPDLGSTSKRRFVTPSNGTGNSGHPGTDYQFDPAVTRFSGRVLCDFPIADENGIGGSQNLSVAPTGALVELLNGLGQVAASGTVDEDGDFEVRGLALDSAGSGTIRIVSATPACIAGATQGRADAFTLASNVAFGDDTDLGTTNITDIGDAGGTFRAPLFIATTVQEIWDEFGRVPDPAVPRFDVVFSRGSNAPTGYVARDGLTPAFARIGSTLSGNDDAYDVDVIQRIWARVLLDSLTGFQGTTHTPGIDVQSTPGNAFAEGFGLFLTALAQNDPTIVDGTTPTTGTSFDIETPVLDNGPSDDVAGWAAAALWDLQDGIDAGNPSEGHDTIDGTDSRTRLLEVIDTIIGEPNASSFTTAWDGAGLDTESQVRSFIRHGIFPDDDAEENDRLATAADAGPVGSVIADRVLNPFNEDWFIVDLATASPGFQATLAFDRFNVTTDLTFEIRNATTGALISTGVAASTTDPFIANSGPLPAGDYALRVVHDSGDRIANYSITTFAQLSIGNFVLPDWTVDTQYEQPVPISGGVPPYVLSVDSEFILPPGITLNGGLRAVRGTPTQVGDYSFILTIEDSAIPPNRVFSAQDIRINGSLILEGAPVIGVAVGQPAEVSLTHGGGTPPYLTAVGDGALLPGLSLDPNEPTLTGTVAGLGSSQVRLDLLDQASVFRSLTTTLVGCMDTSDKNAQLPLAADAAATGFWVDALAGSAVTLKVKTAKKRAKRTLDAFIVDADGNRVESGKVKGGKGKAAFSKVIAPHTGRFYFVMSSDQGEETALQGAAKIQPAKKVSGSVTDFGLGGREEISIGAFAGSSLSFAAKADKSGLLVTVQALVSPSGKITFAPQLDLSVKKTSVSFSRNLDETGTWRVILIHSEGPAGSAKYSAKVKQPKGAVFSLDD